MGRLLDTLRKKKRAALRAADVERAIAPDVADVEPEKGTEVERAIAPEKGEDSHAPGTFIRNLPHPHELAAHPPLHPRALAARLSDLEARVAVLELNS